LTQNNELNGRLDTWIEGNRSKIISSVQELIAIPSVLGEPAPGAPFGVETREALDYYVNLAQSHGIPTTSFDGYAAHAEIGSGEKLIGVLSHVDVVPEGNDWKHKPFGGQVEDGKIFGRGAVDDKGPTIAAFYAILALKMCGVPLNKRIRAIVGADEESGFRCMEYYFKHAEMPEFGFTPDGSFPAIYAEKGIASPVVTVTVPEDSASLRLVSLNAGTRSNMVPDVDIDRLTVRAKGVGAHASTPDEGRNAVVILADALLSVSALSGAGRRVIEGVRAVAVDTTGGGLGIAGTDSITSPLTSNLGVVKTEDGKISMTFSVRYPVTWKGDDVASKIKTAVAEYDMVLESFADSKPLFVPKDDPFLAVCLDVYRRETGDNSEPKTMGGGTYARVLAKGVAFGADFPGFPTIAHQADEFWYIDDLIQATKIYAKTLAKLCE
jgi:succinyl-diaminopimelate desuccinylase